MPILCVILDLNVCVCFSKLEALHTVPVIHCRALNVKPSLKCVSVCVCVCDCVCVCVCVLASVGLELSPFLSPFSPFFLLLSLSVVPMRRVCVCVCMYVCMYVLG